MNQADSQEEMENIKLKRGFVATNFAYIEAVIANIISTYYFKEINKEFVDELLGDEYFNFGLLLHIFEKVLQKESIKDFPTDKIRKFLGKIKRLSQLRNIVVHSQVTARAEGVKGTSRIISMDEIEFKHGGKKLDIKSIFDEYDRIGKEIRETLGILPGGKQTLVQFL